MHNFLDRVAEQLRPVYEGVLESVGQRDVVYADKTGYPVDGDQHRLWAFVTGEEVLYQFADNGGSDVLEAVLGDAFDEEAVLGCDGWSAHPCFHSLLQRCWAHLLREAEYVAARYAEGETLSEELHAIFEEATEFVERDPSQTARERKRTTWSDRLEALATQEYEAEEVNKLGTKLDNGLGFWLTFGTHPEVDPTNNRAERAIREQVILRKVFGGLRSKRATEIHEIITTMLSTWQKRGLDPPEELISIPHSAPLTESRWNYRFSGHFS